MTLSHVKILQLCSAREIGGGERHLIDLTTALMQRGHDLYAAVRPSSPLLAELHHLPKHNILPLRMRSVFDLSSALKLARFVRMHQIEIIHAHAGRDYFLAALAARWAGHTPFVLTRHVLFPLKKLHKITLRHVSGVIAVSQAVAESLRAQHLFHPSKLVTIHNGIDTRRFTRHENPPERQWYLHQTGASLLVGMIGHLAPIKGQAEFIRAAAMLAQQRADVGFIIAGDDKSRNGEHRALIERLIAELGLGARVYLTGWLKDVTPLLSALDVFVSPSLAEPFGLAIIEAMACGVPVIASMSEGAREIITDGVNGRLIPIGDAPALAQAMTELLADTNEQARLSANAYLTVRQRFSLEGMIDATEQLYRRVLMNSGSHSLI